ncbi:hypothetical protein M501DRAFT_1021109 [Patellaria atrata CBS 101060]|uniref:Uncharacterized protein n=1 Tax=Patellaria atrata CBS 101060 TaxID=1346257 RepID=A0A9P4S0J7_9PEZI|nr:hypothetical protein M501DRAFT_1021109 [Patellaria atrata CBS 101060]
MKVHARTETLSDIGSAFSVSYNKAVTSSSSLLPSRPVSSTRPVLRLTLDPAAGDCTTPAEKTPRARLSAWLRRSLPSSPAHPNPPVPFYQCAPIPSQRPATATTTASQAQALTSNPPTPPFSSEWHRRTRTSFSTITTTTLEEVEEPASPSYTEATGLGGVVWGKEGVSVGDGGRLREVGIGIRKEGDMPPRYQVVDPHPNSPRGVIGVAF